MAVKNLHKMAVVGFLLCTVFVAQIKADLKITFVEDICQLIEPDSVTLTLTDESGILKSVERVFSSIGYMNCQIKMIPKYGRSIVLGINQYHTYPGDELSLRDSDGFEISLIGYGLFPDEKKSFTSNGPINIHFIRNNTGYKLPRGFQMTYTQVKSAPCYSDQFQCKNDFCISSDLLCDGHNHCGDRSDQTKCVPESKSVKDGELPMRARTTSLVIFLGVAAIVVAIIITIVIVVLLVRRPKKNITTEQENNSNHAPNATPSNESFCGRIRASLRRKPAQVPVVPQSSSPQVFQVPSMYPSLNHATASSPQNGINQPRNHAQVPVNPQSTSPQVFQAPAMYPSLNQVSANTPPDGMNQS